MTSLKLPCFNHPFHQNLSKALHTTTYVLNIRPTKQNRTSIPYYSLFISHPNYAELRVFGWLCFPMPMPLLRTILHHTQFHMFFLAILTSTKFTLYRLAIWSCAHVSSFHLDRAHFSIFYLTTSCWFSGLSFKSLAQRAHLSSLHAHAAPHVVANVDHMVASC
jgi:hypothetical protein